MAGLARTLPVIQADRWLRTTLQSNTGNKLHTTSFLGKPLAPHNTIGDTIPKAIGCSDEKTQCIVHLLFLHLLDIWQKLLKITHIAVWHRFIALRNAVVMCVNLISLHLHFFQSKFSHRVSTRMVTSSSCACSPIIRALFL